jgi:competence protein ComEA
VARRVRSLFGEPVDGRVARLEDPEGMSRIRWRLDPGRRAAAAMGVAALVAALIAGGWVLANRPHTAALARSSASANASMPSSGAATAAAAASRSRASSSTAAATVVVDVEGQVARPGVYRLPAGSRVDDALAAAGGVLPGVDLSTLNRAQVLSDGQQIAVAVPGAPAAAPAGSGSAGGPGAPINLNTATAEQLDALPGVGPVLAAHIVDWRTQHGRFTSVDQLREVSGIGEAKFADLKSLVTV